MTALAVNVNEEALKLQLMMQSTSVTHFGMCARMRVLISIHKMSSAW